MLTMQLSLAITNDLVDRVKHGGGIVLVDIGIGSFTLIDDSKVAW